MDTTATNIFGMNLEELGILCAENGMERFRAGQIFEWMYGRGAVSFEEMTNLSLGLRAALQGKYAIRRPVPERSATSADGTTKYLFQLEDGKQIESVLIPSEPVDDDEGGEPATARRLTLCVSTQAGCALDCKFCATGSMKLLRNLTPGEIAGQFMEAQSASAAPITNIVYMGMGEPLMNYGAVMQSIEIISNEKGAAISPNRITISTAGIVPAIKRMADEQRRNKLAISLHSCDNEVRTRLMPITRKYNLKSLLDAAEYYYARTRKRVTFEYILFEGVNDKPADIRNLVKLTRRIPSKVNIIPFHPIDAAFPGGVPLALNAVSPERMERFAQDLRAAGVTVMFRSSSGKDINAACGQLAVATSREKKVTAIKPIQN